MSPAATPYYAPAALSTLFYDEVAAEDPAIAGDVDLYARLAQRRSTILELGAGTGRVAIALAEKGFDVTGLDIAPAMLAQAEAKRLGLPEDVARRVRFVRGDMTALALGRRFDAVFATYFTLSHIPPFRWKRVLAGIARHLVPGGIVGLHLPVRDQMAAPPPSPDQPVMRRQVEGGRTLSLFVAGRDFDEETGRMDLSLDYVLTGPDGTESRSRERLTYFAADPVPFAAAAGLCPIDTPIPLGRSGVLHLFGKPAGAGENGAIDGT